MLLPAALGLKVDTGIIKNQVRYAMLILSNQALEIYWKKQPGRSKADLLSTWMLIPAASEREEAESDFFQ
jgi:hypothetical protein